jgi:hypothetical protein
MEVQEVLEVAIDQVATAPVREIEAVDIVVPVAQVDPDIPDQYLQKVMTRKIIKKIKK